MLASSALASRTIVGAAESMAKPRWDLSSTRPRYPWTNFGSLLHPKQTQPSVMLWQLVTIGRGSSVRESDSVSPTPTQHEAKRQTAHSNSTTSTSKEAAAVHPSNFLRRAARLAEHSTRLVRLRLCLIRHCLMRHCLMQRPRAPMTWGQYLQRLHSRRHQQLFRHQWNAETLQPAWPEDIADFQ